MFRIPIVPLLLLGLVVSTGSGCRSSFQGNFLRRDLAQAPAAQADQPDPAEVVRRVALDHERRSQLVQALKVSDLNIKIDTFRDQNGNDRSPLLGGTAGGSMVLERARNLRVMLRKPPGMAVADIGSNDREFWFVNDLSNEMVVGSYAQTEGFADPMLASVRPDWIFEVLGLEPLPEDLEIAPGETDATLTLIEQRRLPNGSTMVKESVLSVVEQRIIEHRLFTEGRGEPIARARVERPETIRLPATGGAEAPETIQIPRIVRLTVPDMAELTMYLGSIKPNPTDDFVANTTFERPVKEGYLVVDVLELARSQGMMLADQSPASIPPPTPPRERASASGPSPGSLSLPRSDREVARTEDVSVETRGSRRPSGFQSISDRSPVSLELPSPSRPAAGVGDGSVEIRRQSWESVEGNRFRRGALGHK
ncbi:hypothetical protein AB1L88_24480 [Tautonia sp. JC769]|uniref:hypothetical protein n=1 Tax=Tautonia sp. JC769 TaxID=3232135 RepID=UPI00345890A7